MKILGKEIDFDFYDYENSKKLEKESEKIKRKMEEIQKNLKTKKLSTVISKTYDAVSESFDELFGEGIAEVIFEGKKNFKMCVQAISDLQKAREQQDEELKLLSEEFTPVKRG